MTCWTRCSERALFGGGRHLVVVDEADEFVSRNRAALEDVVARPGSTSVLLLDVKQWPATTRLYKAVAESGLQIECKFPPPARLLKWLASWIEVRHGARLEAGAAELLAESVEPELGLFDQELAKLAATAGQGGTVSAAMVRETVGGWRTRTAWEMLDEALEGERAGSVVAVGPAAGRRRGADRAIGSNGLQPAAVRGGGPAGRTSRTGGS